MQILQRVDECAYRQRLTFVSNNDDMTLVLDRVPFATSVAITRK
jgi:hypothetical protein